MWEKQLLARSIYPGVDFFDINTGKTAADVVVPIQESRLFLQHGFNMCTLDERDIIMVKHQWAAHYGPAKAKPN